MLFQSAGTVHSLIRPMTALICLFGVAAAEEKAPAAEDAPAAAQDETVLAEPPAEARKWSIVSSAGKHGEEFFWTDEDGVQWSRMSILLRGLTWEQDMAVAVNDAGLPTRIVINGVSPSGDASETFEVADGVAKWKSPVDEGAAAWTGDAFYAPQGGPASIGVTMFNALMADEDKRIETLPGGAVSLSELTNLEVTVDGETRNLAAYTLDGLGFSPQPMWADESGEYFASIGWIGWIPEGWESVRDQLAEAQDAAMAERAPAIKAKLERVPETPVLIRNVTLYDADAGEFKKKMSVLIEGGKIKTVGPKGDVKAPKGGEKINGKGKTLVPGLWDMHAHFSGDENGVFLLAQGITSIRDIGNERAALSARKARIDGGELLGPKIYAILGVDGDGPFSAQGFERIRSVEDGKAAVRLAKDEGFLGVKLYGTVNPDWVVPIAEEAHALGLSVQGHVPAGMRTSRAVNDGYDGINHINFVIMEAAPDDVLAKSNGLMRFFGPGLFAKDTDLSEEPMASFLDLLEEKQTVIDPTLAVYEAIFVPEPGEVTPAYTPYLGIVPSSVERGFKGGGLKAPEGFAATREDMRASFDALVALTGELHRRGVPVVAGTDGYGIELVRELELYVRAGMTIEEALATATIGAARIFGVDGETGSIAEGKDADMFLVDGDVSEDIGLLRQVDLVIRGGVIMEGDALRETAGITGRPSIE